MSGSVVSVSRLLLERVEEWEDGENALLAIAVVVDVVVAAGPSDLRFGEFSDNLRPYLVPLPPLVAVLVFLPVDISSHRRHLHHPQRPHLAPLTTSPSAVQRTHTNRLFFITERRPRAAADGPDDHLDLLPLPPGVYQLHFSAHGRAPQPRSPGRRGALGARGSWFGGAVHGCAGRRV